MIENKKQFWEYVYEDFRACGVVDGIYVGDVRSKLSLCRYAFGLNKLHYQFLLRYSEYITNCCKLRFYGKMVRWHCRNLGTKLGFHIPFNICGKGLNLAHEGTVIISWEAKIGEYCRIHAGVNIGVNGDIPGAPVIGNGVYIGPGAKIFGPIEIADFVAIGANAVVNESIAVSNLTVAGIPAKVISNKGSRKLLYYPNEM